MKEAAGRREMKKQAARQRIIEAAINQFRQGGFQQTSVADIMSEAHMGLGTFYNYFTSKDELLHSLLDNLSVSLQTYMQELETSEFSQAQILESMVMQTAKMVNENKYVLPLFLSAGEAAAGEHGHKSEAHGVMEEKGHPPAFITMFLHLVQQGQSKGDFRRDIPAELITEMFHSVFQAAAFSHLPLCFEENIRLKVKLMIDGICVK